MGYCFYFAFVFCLIIFFVPYVEMAGIFMSYFSSDKGHAPKMAWDHLGSYPAINGHTLYSNVTFAGFNCPMQQSAIRTNPGIGDIFHPFHVEGKDDQ